MLRRAALLALALAPLASGLVWAQPVGVAPEAVTPDRAAAIQQQLRAWLADTLGPDIKVARDPIQFKADGDHYDVVVPFGNTPDAPAMTATAKPASDGRWALDGVRLTSPSTFHFKLPASAATDNKPSEMTSSLTIGQQTGQMLIDPSFKTPSTSSSTMSDLKIEQTGLAMQQSSTLGHGTSNTVVTPAADGRLDIALTGNFDDYAIKAVTTKEQTPIAVGMSKVAFNGTFSGVSRERLVAVAHLLGQINAANRAAASPAAPSAPATADPAAVHALLDAMADLATGLNFDEKVDALSFDVGGVKGGLHAMNIGMTTRSDAGLLQAAVAIGAEGLTLPDLGLGKLAELIPSKLTIRPSVTGLPTDALRRIMDKLEAKQDPSDDDIQSVFSHGPVTAGIDSLGVDVAGAAFTGSGKVLMTSPTAFSGAGQVQAENLDQLQHKLAADPQTARAVPVIIFLKGIGRTEQNHLVWDIVYKDGHVLVNNQDMAALTGSVAPTQPATPAVPPAARPRLDNPEPVPGRPVLRPAPRRQP